MIQQSQIKKSTGLDDISTFSGYSNNTVGQDSVIEVIGGENLKKASDYFLKILNTRRSNRIDLVDFMIFHETNLVLTPKEIETFVNLTSNYNLHENFSDRSGFIISRLILNSYNQDNRNNNFNLNISDDSKINYLGFLLKTGDDPIKLNINGDVGDKFGKYSRNLISNIEGNVGADFGSHSMNLTAIVNGNVDNDYGFNSEGFVTLVIGDDSGCFGSYSVKMMAFIDGTANTSFGVDSRHGYFVVKDSVYGNNNSWRSSMYKNIYSKGDKEYDQAKQKVLDKIKERLNR